MLYSFSDMKIKKSSGKLKDLILLREKILVLLFLLLALGGIQLGLSKSQYQSIQNPCGKNGCITVPTPTPYVPKPKPTLTPTPTPKSSPVNYGYCLYVPVPYYHHIQPQSEAIANKQTSVSIDSGIFESQMAYINSHGYTAISALDLVNALRTHTGLPGKSIVVTIDDGYSDLYTRAFPIIKRYNIHISAMIPSGLVGNPGFITWDQLREMQSSGLVYFVDHSWSHYSATNNLAKAKYEIETARTQLEANLGQKVDLYAYPYGSYNNLEIQILQQDGFLGAFSTLGGSYQCDSFIYTLHRVHIGNAPLSAYGL